jgi:hypothetical protein
MVGKGVWTENKGNYFFVVKVRRLEVGKRLGDRPF